MNYYLDVLKNYAVFTGRARRKEFWIFQLVSFLVGAIFAILDIVLGLYNTEIGAGVLSSLYALGVFIPNLALGTRRLHDTGRSGWWFLLFLIPLIGAIVLIVFFCLDSEPGTNQYGEYPK